MSSLSQAIAGTDDGPTVEAANESLVVDVDVDRWARVAVETLMAEQIEAGHLDLTFIDPAEMADLNEAHMGHDGPTDVLSFPLDGGDDRVPDPDLSNDGPPLLLGDIVICPQVAIEQAPGHCGDVDSELTLLVVHGVLHILGHDHAEPAEEAVMVGREAIHLERYGLTHPGPAGPDQP